MSGGRRRARLLIALLVMSSTLLAPGAARGAAPPFDTASMLAQRGFGESQNSYAWAMAWFKGKLYVGTGRSVMCVEAATTQFYFEFTTVYRTHLAPHVDCPRNMYDLDLRAEIWQYTPRTGRWRMVLRSPADIRNPRARGKFLARDTAFRGMKVVRDRHGREALFVSGVTADEYVPEIARRHPPRLLRTYDGRHFHDISVPLVVRRSGGFVDRRPVGYRGLEVFRKRLYVVASTALAGDGAVFRVDRPFARKARFSQVTPRDMHVFEMQTFDRQLYVGTGSFDTGYAVYKTRATGDRPRFHPVVTGGAGLGSEMVSVVSMHPFHGHLYVGGVSWYHPTLTKLPAAELIRIGHDDRWQVVSGDPRPGPDGRMLYPISGLPAGFGNIFNSHLWRMVDSAGALYVGTLDWSWLLQESESWSEGWTWAIDGVLGRQYGFDLWASCDGVEWFPITYNAFGRDTYDFGVRGLTAGRRGFYLGTANHAFGTRIWFNQPSACASAKTASQPGAARAPGDLIADAQRDGTVVSWEPSSGAVRYRIERARYLRVPLSVRPPPVAPGSFPAEDAQPQPVAPGAPGSVEVQAPIQEPFKEVGTTSRAYFVDWTRRPGASYAYRVVAETRGGKRSRSSNVQMVPDPRPPATFGQLERAGVPSSAVAAIAGSYRRGGRRSLAGLARLARTASDDSVRLLASRLERQLRYGKLAGGR